MTVVFIIICALIALFGFVVAFGAPYVPSLRREVRGAFDSLYPLGGADTIVDLGSGDGSVLVEASRHGAACYGVELNPLLVIISRLRLRKKAKITLGNMWLYKLPARTTLVYVFSVSRDAKKLEKFMQIAANRHKREIALMTFGPDLGSRQPVARHNAHALYLFKPLQVD